MRLARIAVPGADQVFPAGDADARHAPVGDPVRSPHTGAVEPRPPGTAGRGASWPAEPDGAPEGPELLDHRQRLGRAESRGVGSLRARVVGALSDHVPPTLRGARWHLSGRAVAGAVVGLAIAVGSAALVAGRAAPEMITPGAVTVTTAPAAPAPLPSGSVATGTPGVVVVHVAGLVATPGVFELPSGSRVVDAVEVAGGAKPGVDTSTLNLARVLVDGEQISVGVPAAPDAAGLQPGGATPAPGAPLDLNTATEAQLDALPGVGPVLAGRIVAWRSEHGAFTAVEELLEVSGIGTATLADLAGLVRV